MVPGQCQALLDPTDPGEQPDDAASLRHVYSSHGQPGRARAPLAELFNGASEA
jgi:hypothetical protein